MKKLLISTIMALTLGTQAFAVPAMHKLFAFKQSDGTSVMLYRCGDEHFSFMTTPDNQIVMKNSAGFYCYAMRQNGSIVASNIRVHDMEQRTADEKNFVVNNTLKPADLIAIYNNSSCNSESSTSAMAKMPLKINGASTSDGLGKYGTKSPGAVPSIGKLTIPVIMVEFTNKKFLETTTSEYMTRYYNEEGFSDLSVYGYKAKGSVKDYFIAQSHGLFEPTFEIVAKVQLDTTYNYYGCHNGTASDYRPMRMVKDAIAKAVAQGVNFKQYYYGNTNKVPLVSILYAGEGEATGGGDDTIWPHEFDIPTYSSNISNCNFGAYFVGNELIDSKNLMGSGVFVHEFSHALSLPDFYVTDYNYDNDDPFGLWSVMDKGEYNDNSYNPIGYTAYEKSFMGWLDLKELTTPESITLGNPNDVDDHSAVIIRNPNRANETFILENRQPGTWYPSSFGTGLMVTRINYDRNAWTQNTTNNEEDFKRACIMPANGQKINDAASASHLYGNDKMKMDSLNLFLGSSLKNPIYNITRHNDGTITMSYLDRTLRPEITSNANRYKKVTSLDEIASLDTIILVNEADERVASTIRTSTGYNSAEIVLNNNMGKGNDDIMVFQLVYSTSSKKWGLKYRSGNTNYYLCASAGGTLSSASKTSAASLATISFDNGNAAIKFGGNYTASTIGYSNEKTNFSCYKSGEGQSIQIYKKVSILTLAEDVNGDDTVDISDVNAVISAICGESITGNADVNGDGAVDISDVNQIISTICGN